MADMETTMTTRAKRRRRHNSMFRALVALEACRPEANAAPVAARHGLAAGQVEAWRRRLLKGVARWPLRPGQEWWF